MKTKLRNQKGFTIIEVLIVLAIAGLILLIVFLAVPALQRNARNTQRKNDVAAIMGAYSEYLSNSNGTAPVGCSVTNGELSFNDGATTPVVKSQAKVGYFTNCSSTVGTAAGYVYLGTQGATATSALSATSANDYAIVFMKGACSSSTQGQVDAVTSRSVATQYQTEAGSGKYSPQCQGS